MGLLDHSSSVLLSRIWNSGLMTFIIKRALRIYFIFSRWGELSWAECGKRHGRWSWVDRYWTTKARIWRGEEIWHAVAFENYWLVKMVKEFIHQLSVRLVGHPLCHSTKQDKYKQPPEAARDNTVLTTFNPRRVSSILGGQGDYNRFPIIGSNETN